MPAQPHYVYSLSSEPRILVQHAMRSVRSLLATTVDEASRVHLFVTPPVHDADIEHFEALGATVHVEEPAFPGGFRTRLGDPRAEYAEKWRLTSVDADTVVFLDCDTVVLDDLRDVIAGDFEVKAREMPPTDADRWRQLFDELGVEPRPTFPNTGFLVFKQRSHETIRDAWERYIRAEIPYYADGYTKEQFALALALSETGLDTARMSDREHVMEWLGESPRDGYLHHLADGSISVPQEVLNAIDGRLPARAQDTVKAWLQPYYDAIESA